MSKKLLMVSGSDNGVHRYTEYFSDYPIVATSELIAGDRVTWINIICGKSVQSSTDLSDIKSVGKYNSVYNQYIINVSSSTAGTITTLDFQLSAPLRSIGDYYDELYWGSNDYYITRRIRQMHVDSTNYIVDSILATSVNHVKFAVRTTDLVTYYQGYDTAVIWTMSPSFTARTYDELITNNNDVEGVAWYYNNRVGDGTAVISVPKSKLSSYDAIGFANFISTTGVDVFYVNENDAIEDEQLYYYQRMGLPQSPPSVTIYTDELDVAPLTIVAIVSYKEELETTT